MNINRPIAIAIILFAALLLAFFFVSPKYREFRALQITEGEKKGEFNAKYDYFSAISKAYFELQNRKDDIKKIDDALPSESEFGRLVYFFQQKADESGLIAKNVFLSKGGPASPGSNVKEIIFSLDLLGSYSSLENFIASLEKSARLFEVKSITFNSETSTESASSKSKSALPKELAQNQTYSFNLEIKTHSY